MRKCFFIVCLMATMIASAQYSEPGFYRVQNAYTYNFMSIKGTAFTFSTRPDAFWTCAVMEADSVQITDVGSIIYIPSLTQTSLYSQGVDTYSLTGLKMDVETWSVMEGGKETYIAKTQYYNEIAGNDAICIFRDFGCGFAPGTSPRYSEYHWWIEPVNEASMETSFLGVKPVSEKVKDANGWYWTTMTCDFPFLMPVDGGVEGAYTVKEIAKGEDGRYYATAEKICGQGEIVPAATPVLLKCKTPYAGCNKIVPVGEVANHTRMPIISDLLMGNYFSNYMNHCSNSDPVPMAEYIPAQATLANANFLALGINDEGELGFFPQAEGTYMAANTAWLSSETLDEDAIVAVYLVEPAGEDPEPQFIPGDANGDNEVNISDVTLLIVYLSYETTQDSGRDIEEELNINLAAADVNKDSQVNISDVTLLIRLLVDGE